MTFGVIIMLGAQAGSPQEKLVLDAQRAAALDLATLLGRHISTPIILSSPDVAWWPSHLAATLEPDPLNIPFHFGERLASLIETYDLERVLYFGGGSAPLLDDSLANMLVGLLSNAGSSHGLPSHIALTNNRHSSDWVAFNQAPTALEIVRKAERDNSLAWSLEESGLFELRVPAGFRPATSMDIDTPTDLAILRAHPHCPPHLRAALAPPELDNIPVQQVVEVFRREGAQTAIIGRISPLAWGAINKATRCWIRVFSEERGMVASERQKRGEVRSMIGELLRAQGMAKFFDTLADMSEAVIFDTRVLMAEGRTTQPTPADRFASDLYAIDRTQDPWLKEFTQAAKEAPIPILLGGHSLVAGGLYALAEIIQGAS